MSRPAARRQHGKPKKASPALAKGRRAQRERRCETVRATASPGATGYAWSVGQTPPVERVLRKAIVLAPHLANSFFSKRAEIDALFSDCDVIYAGADTNGRSYRTIVVLWKPQDAADQRWVEQVLKTRLLPGGELVWLV